MKKIISMFLALTLLLCCAACGETDNNPADTAVTTTTESTTTTVESTTTTTESTTTTTAADKKEEIILDFLPLDFYFSSGAGGWGTELTLNPDGTFTGKYHDSELGSTGEDYPYGTYYICEFSGSFENITKVDEYSYEMTIGKVTVKDEMGKEWIEDGVKYIASYPYGLEDSETFMLFKPDTPIYDFSEEFLSWWPGRYEEERGETLGYYSIMNVEQVYGFFTFE